MELNISKISESKFCFKWNDPLRKTNVEIRLPNLQSLKKSVWGDWGPMYTFELKSDRPITISYDNRSKKLDQKSLLIESPMIADEREQFPFYILVEDNDYGFHHYLYLDRKFDLGKVVIKRVADRIKLFESFSGDVQFSSAI